MPSKNLGGMRSFGGHIRLLYGGASSNVLRDLTTSQNSKSTDYVQGRVSKTPFFTTVTTTNTYVKSRSIKIGARKQLRSSDSKRIRKRFLEAYPAFESSIDLWAPNTVHLHELELYAISSPSLPYLLCV